MKRPYTAGAVVLIAAFFFSNSTGAFAFGGPPGGPFGPGSNFSNDGTFSAVVRGENLAGVLQFSTSAGPGAVDPIGGGLGSTGIATIYFDGDTYQGNSQGSIDPAASTLSVNFQAGAQGQGENDFTVQTIVIDPATQAPAYQDTQEFLYFDSLYFSGFADCKTSNSFPNQKFSGNGEAELQYLDFSAGIPLPVAIKVPLFVNGVRLSNQASQFATRDVRPPSVNSLTILRE